LGRSGITAAAFGSVAGVTAIYYLSGVPRVQRDILQVFPRGLFRPFQSSTWTGTYSPDKGSRLLSANRVTYAGEANPIFLVYYRKFRSWVTTG
jgi:hypothetical protein